MHKKAIQFSTLLIAFGLGAGGFYLLWDRPSHDVLQAVAKKLIPSVANIATSGRVEESDLPPWRTDFFQFFKEGPEPLEDDLDSEPPESLGSGFAVGDDLVLTSLHVIQGAESIWIKFSTTDAERPLEARVVGSDPELDLALLRVRTESVLPRVKFGDSDDLEVGDMVLAIGNPFGQGHSVSHGIISAKNRDAPEFRFASYLQTDAPINPGNSGGPLVNLKGEVIGMSSAIDLRAQGIGFALPINPVKESVEQLLASGKVERGDIGVQLGVLNSEISKLLGAPASLKAPFIVELDPAGTGIRAGLRPYDILLQINGKRIHDPKEFLLQITEFNEGSELKLEVLREGKSVAISVPVGVRSSEWDQVARVRDPVEEVEKRLDPVAQIGMEMEWAPTQVQTDLGYLSNSKPTVLVTSVDPEGPSDLAGLQEGDLIVEVDRRPVVSVASVYESLSKGHSHLLKIRRMTEQGEKPMVLAYLTKRK